jgi:hypothetical protein
MLVKGVRSSAKGRFACSLMREEMMYQSASITGESSDDFTVVAIIGLLGLALTLLAIGDGLIDAESMIDFLLLF